MIYVFTGEPPIAPSAIVESEEHQRKSIDILTGEEIPCKATKHVIQFRESVADLKPIEETSKERREQLVLISVPQLATKMVITQFMLSPRSLIDYWIEPIQASALVKSSQHGAVFVITIKYNN